MSNLGTPPRDYSVDAGTVREHLANILQMLDDDRRVGFWERRRTVHAIRARLRAALDLLDGRIP